MGRKLPSGFQYIPASKTVTTVLEENIFTGVKIGYESGGKDYEEVSGLSSPHGQADFSLALKYQDENRYSKLSKIRADLEAYDLARRKQSIDYPDTDTSYDQDLFFRHLKKVGTQFVMRTWQDDLAERPQGEGVYSPDTMGNLLLTPFRCLKRHGRILATSVVGKPYGKVVFTGSNCFSSFTTQKIDEDEIQEDGSLLNKDLGKAYINGMLLSFSGRVFQTMIDEFEGYQIIEGERVPNWYGRFEVMVGEELQYGRIISSNITGEGKHEIALI